MKADARSGELERILLCRTDRLGDVILSLPCVRLLRGLFPRSRISFLAQPYTAPIACLLEGLDEVLELDQRLNVRQLAGLLREKRFDAAVVLYPDFRLARALRMAKIPLRAGIAYRWFSPLFSYRHREHRKLNLKHEVDYNLSLTFSTFRREGRWEDVLQPQELFPLNLTMPPEASRKVATYFDRMKGASNKIVALHPGGGGSAHRWPLVFFCELARRLVESADVHVIVTGDASEAPFGEEVVEAAGGDSLNLCGKVSLPELAEVYRRSHLLIANSTGPLHLGRAVGTPVLGLFPSDRAMSPVRWGPYGLPDAALTPPQGMPISELSVGMVLERALKLLEGCP